MVNATRNEIVSAGAEPRPILTTSEQRLVAEALRRAEETRNVMEDALVGFGRWMLVSVFDDDASAALEGRSANAVWADLVRRAGGPTLRLNKKLLYVALHIAARDKRITDGKTVAEWLGPAQDAEEESMAVKRRAAAA